MTAIRLEPLAKRHLADVADLIGARCPALHARARPAAGGLPARVAGYLIIPVDNAPSLRVAARCGYVREGVLRSIHLEDGVSRAVKPTWSMRSVANMDPSGTSSRGGTTGTSTGGDARR